MASPPIIKTYIRKDPITSYGILLFYTDQKGDRRYLLAQRRDTIEYADYLRGRYSYANLEVYFSLMSQDERFRLVNYTFDELWDDLWVNRNTRFYREARAKASAKFEEKRELMLSFLKNTTSVVTEPRWGFPKGKRNINETDVECAMREFKEETRMHINHDNLLNLPPSKEVFKGTNGVMYSTVYYVARTPEVIPIKKIPTRGIRTETVSEEVANMRWCTIREARHLLNPWREKLLLEVDFKITKHLRKK